MTNKLFTTKEIMELLGLAQPTISKYVKKGMPVAGKVDFGKGNVYNLKDVTDWIKEHTKPAGRPKKCDECMVDDLPLSDGEYEELDELGKIYGLKLDSKTFFEKTVNEMSENIQQEKQKPSEEESIPLILKARGWNEEKPYSYVKPKVFKHKDMPVCIREDLHDKVKREALRHNVTMKKLVEDIVAYHLEVKI